MTRVLTFALAVLLFIGCDTFNSSDAPVKELRVNGNRVVQVETDTDTSEVEINLAVRTPGGENVAHFHSSKLEELGAFPLTASNLRGTEVVPVPSADTAEAIDSYAAVVDGEVVDRVESVESRSDLRPVSFE